MARLIQKSGYFKGGSGVGYMRYVAQREGVEITSDTGPVTQKQQKLITKIQKASYNKFYNFIITSFHISRKSKSKLRLSNFTVPRHKFIHCVLHILGLVQFRYSTNKIWMYLRNTFYIRSFNAPNCYNREFTKLFSPLY